jgi:hypothetical protein
MKNCTINLRQLISGEHLKRRAKKQAFCAFVETQGATAAAHRAHKRRANKCLLCKQIIFKLFHQKTSTTLIAFQRFFALPFFYSPHVAPSLEISPLNRCCRAIQERKLKNAH